MPSPDMSRSRKRLIILAMTGSLSMIMIDMTMLAVALPRIGSELQVGETTLHWVLNSYVLVLASAAALGGRVGDLLGKPQVFVAGAIVFALASLASGFATSGGFLVAARIVQGLAAAVMQPASSAIVISTSTPESRGRTMAFYLGIPLLFLTFGPALGGVITEYASWRWIFFINLPVAIGAIVLALVARPPAMRSRGGRLDPLAVALLLVSLPAVVGAIQQAPDWGAFDPRTLGLMIGGIVGLFAFAWRQKRAEAPVLHLEFFRDRGFLCAGLLLLVMQFSLSGSLIQLSIYAQKVLGYDPLHAGLAILPLMIPVLFFIHVAGRLYDRLGVRMPAMVGAAGSAAGLLVMGIGMLLDTYLVIAAGMVVLGVSCSFVSMPANTDGLSRIDATERAQASGLLQTARQLGSALGIAAFFAVSSISGSPGIAVMVGAGVTTLGILFAGLWKPRGMVSAEAP